ELTAAIRRAGVMAQNEKLKEANTQAAVRAGHSSTSGRNYGDSGKIILVFSPKGGSGSTTLTTNLGVALHSEETPVVVVDGKLQFGDLSFFYNQQGPNNVTDLAPRGNELDHQVVEEVLVVHESSGVSILSAPPQLERSEEVSGVEFSQILKYLRRMFSYIIIDTGSNLDEVTLAGIDIADLIVLITTQDIPAIKNVRLFMNLTDLLGVDRNQILFLLNKFDKRRSINADRIGDITKQTVMGTIPVDEKFVIPAMDRGIPFIIENPSNSVSKAVFKFAEVLKERIAENDQVEEFELEN
ncbi:MAG: AAA family ATPase, partial [Chloroflexi bacterium]|nr:AAA family ATPase [Chloroflexota bacterium]